MAFDTPKIEYLNASETGTTATGSGTISAMVDTSDIQSGMFVKGAGVPTGALVDTVGATSITLASGVLCTASATVALTFGFAIEFSYPPKEPTGEKITSSVNSSESLSGVRQVSLNYLEAFRELTFSFLSESIKSSLQTFLTTHALLGNSFRYFDDKNSASYVEYELDDFKYTPKKIAPVGEDIYIWEVPLKFRRAL